jgi:hypothetical protein
MGWKHLSNITVLKRSPKLLIEPTWDGNMLSTSIVRYILLLLIEPTWDGNYGFGGRSDDLAGASNRTNMGWKPENHTVEGDIDGTLLIEPTWDGNLTSGGTPSDSLYF